MLVGSGDIVVTIHRPRVIVSTSIFIHRSPNYLASFMGVSLPLFIRLDAAAVQPGSRLLAARRHRVV